MGFFKNGQYIGRFLNILEYWIPEQWGVLLNMAVS
jgi:hypothetical protein